MVEGCRSQDGFTLLELMVAFAMAALLVGVTTPAGLRFYDTMQYRSAVGDLRSAATNARYRAITTGQPVDLLVAPEDARFAVMPAARDSGQNFDLNTARQLAGDLDIQMVSAEGLSPMAGVGAIRFYPDGSSTGGSITVLRPTGVGVRLRVDWLLGRISQESPEQDSPEQDTPGMVP